MKRIRGVKPETGEERIGKNEELRRRIGMLPGNYNFEIPKTLFRIEEVKAKRVGLQMPEGLQMFACVLSDILTEFGKLEECIILADIVFGACCVEDLTAEALSLDLLVHYGHSCLIPISDTCMRTLYVFVDIQINIQSLVDTLIRNFPDPSQPVALVSTIQFVEGIYQARQVLREKGFEKYTIPQSKPRTAGELLGCTSPVINSPVIVSVSDGRFHLEAAMIQNPTALFYRYDPYLNKIFKEEYGIDEMKNRRRKSIEQAKQANYIGIILGTLGRQGSVHILKQLMQICRERGKRFSVFLMSDVCQSAIEKYEEVEAWVEIACPRLAIDWGCEFSKPMLCPYELFVAFNDLPLDYPMDNYMYGGGKWSVYTAKEEAKKDVSGK
jgi:2-(3-amino-3-carboxypropyl)histidine synthase